MSTSTVVKLVFEVPLNEVELSPDGQFYNLPYRLSGTFGKKKAFMRGKRVTIPVNQKDPAKKVDKAVSLTNAQVKDLV